MWRKGLLSLQHCTQPFFKSPQPFAASLAENAQSSEERERLFYAQGPFFLFIARDTRGGTRGTVS